MKLYLNSNLKPNEDNKNHKLNLTNTVSLETLSNTEKEFKNHSTTPLKLNFSNQHLFLKRVNEIKETMSDIESTGNNSEKNILKLMQITESKKIIINPKNKNKNENDRYNNKDNENNTNLNSQITPVRRDIFGREIKKGGKHKISFADNVHILQARMKFEKKGIKGNSNRNSNRNSIELNTPPHSDKTVRKGLRRSLIEIKNQKFFKNFDFDESKKVNKLVEVIEVIKMKIYMLLMMIIMIRKMKEA